MLTASLVTGALLVGPPHNEPDTRRSSPPVPPQIEWVNVSDVLNRDVSPDEAPEWFPKAFPDYHIHAGGVDHPYRIMRSPITNRQWLEFVEAYAPFWEGDTFLSSFTGTWIRQVDTPDGDVYVITPGLEDHAANMSWHFAARYCNWLHNGKVNEAWAFEDGAYDASTFTQNPDNTWNSQTHHDPSARYWIPTLSELVKALYWDPDKDDGAGGYWRYPDSGDEPLVPGFPWDGGETAAGLPFDLAGPWVPAGSYPDVRSPWGPLDASGFESQWIEDENETDWRLNKGTEQFFSIPDSFDELQYLGVGFPNTNHSGLRAVARSLGACRVDLALPLGKLDIADAFAFVQLFQEAASGADLTAPYGRIDFLDVIEFLVEFSRGDACEYALQ